ncbi:helix-turn-helix domain-containing protein [Paenibacillus sp. SYP-B3998]|uniref:Helix-turn-helix domain-containing protein n=1 Tax=Paenibacillus sp. SYP-B3998 TaxID=2678564 RepID=A0A6G3ZYM6_9BACL|nr:helix-turn-helix domain-containing protein [Paenibacillus sp. SYP-B3998]NEW06681.1 helix-turn-helix domain-containing protein [Paenibacillus sp. SYP-B3998]
MMRIIQTGFTPHQFMVHLRVERPKLLIRCGYLSLKEVAYQVGFADQGHFSKVFKKLVEITAVQFPSLH